MTAFNFKEIIKSGIYKNGRKNDDYDFHTSRIMFAFPNGEPDYRKNDPRDHATWLYEEYGVSEEEFDQTDRGYLKVLTDSGKPYVQCIVYRGLDFQETHITEKVTAWLKDLASEHFPGMTLRIYTGCVIGKVGDVWPPKRYIAEYKLKQGGNQP